MREGFSFMYQRVCQRVLFLGQSGREADCRPDTGIEDGIGLGAVWGRAGDLQRAGKEPQKGRRLCAPHLFPLA